MKGYDLIIIGGGAAGFAAAIEANERNARTLLINNDTVGLGGTCVNEGCLPTKHLLAAAEHLHSIKSKRFQGINSDAAIDFKTIMDAKEKLVNGTRAEKYELVLDNLRNVDFRGGNAHFVSKNKISINDNEYTPGRFIVATGSSTVIPRIHGIDHVRYLTNREILRLKELPKSLIVLGGGALGVEFAQMFARFGSRVTIIEYAAGILPGAEPELSTLLRRYLEEEGIEILTSARIESVNQNNGYVSAGVFIDGREIKVKGTTLLLSAGRRPNVLDMGLENTGITTGVKGEILTDVFMKAADGVYAAGDVTGEPMLETVAAKEGYIAAKNALALAAADLIEFDRRVVPAAVFSDPQLASVGFTDSEANNAGIECKCVTIPMSVVPKASAVNDTRGAIKMVVNARTEEIVGIHVLSSNAADLIHEGAMIIKNNMRLADVTDTLHVFPTLSEGIKIAAQAFTRDIRKMTCCVQ